MENLHIDMKVSWRNEPALQIPSSAVAHGSETEPVENGKKGGRWVRRGGGGRSGVGISLPVVAIHAPATSPRQACYSGALRILSWFPNAEIGHLHLSLVDTPGTLTRQALSSFFVDARACFRNVNRLTLYDLVVSHYCSAQNSGIHILPFHIADAIPCLIVSAAQELSRAVLKDLASNCLSLRHIGLSNLMSVEQGLTFSSLSSLKNLSSVR